MAHPRPLPRPLPLLLLALPLLTLGACSGVRVHQDFEPGTDFSAFTTYAWLRPPQSADPRVSEFDLDRIRRAVDAALAGHGFRPAPQDEAGVLVSVNFRSEEKMQISDPYYAYRAVELYDEGTLVVDLVEREERTLLWRGVGQARLLDFEDPKEREPRIRDAVERILGQYPPD